VVTAFPHGEQSPLWGYVEPTPTKAEMEKCKTFYDPCTKEALGPDVKDLVARVEEIQKTSAVRTGGTRRVRTKGKRKTRRQKD
jgi:hypothetical protein